MASITAVTGDVKSQNPYRKRLVGKQGRYKAPTEKDLREQKEKAASL